MIVALTILLIWLALGILVALFWTMLFASGDSPHPTLTDDEEDYADEDSGYAR